MKLEILFDQYGQYVNFTISGVSQRFRWIQPGRFIMGSPPTEPERCGDECLHEVILSKGFWFADTVCSQALWEAVMGSNPSQFKGKKRPVENVSWNDCIAFLEKLNIRMPGFNFRLPTEAEWEYACRAGTTTPFNTGDNLTTDQANYNGNYPYRDYPKGKYIGQTTLVVSYPPNAWGVYDMHGNVWERCSDWYDKYPADSVIDPVGSDICSGRVLRGGSWDNRARYCRSADRGGVSPAGRSGLVGFRLVFVP